MAKNGPANNEALGLRAEIESAAHVLVGKTLWTCRRAADMATFQFGVRTNVVDFYGRPSQVGEFALHVQCAWRVVGDDEVVLVGSQDLYYPAEYEDVDKVVPEDFDWVRDPNRRDRLLRELFDEGGREFVVRSVEAGGAGSVRILMSEGLALELFPNDSLPGERWRLFRPGVDEPHFVVTGRGIET